MSENKFFYIKTFGCQMNVRDSEIIAESLGSHGYAPVAELERAGTIIVNTCAIRAKAEQKLYSYLGGLRRFKRHNPQVKICVAGCVAQQEKAEIVRRMPHVDLVVGTQHIHRLPELLHDSPAPAISVELSDQFEIPLVLPCPEDLHGEPRTSRTAPDPSRFVTIMQGCNNYCTYCVVPYTRGRETSRPPADILAEVKANLDLGIKEIVLLGQNVNSYGRSRAADSSIVYGTFSELLHRIAELDGLKRLRFTTSNPQDLSPELVRCFIEIPELCSHFHLPVQAGSDRILKRMNRQYSIAEYLEKVEQLREARTDIALTTDIIVGFPGELDSDFEQSMDLLETVRFHGSFSFKYSDRPNTRAAAMEPKVDEAVKTRRLAIFQQRQDQISLERNREYLGTVKEIMIEKATSEAIVGRTTTNHIVHLEGTAGRPAVGDFLEVEIIGAGKHSLRARRR